MISAVIFDLDGTLVQTEKLKAVSYAKAAVELCPGEVSEQSVVHAFRDVVGLSRREVATTLLERFGLTEAARARMAEFSVETPWQAYLHLRLHHYKAMLADPSVLLNNQWPHNMTLLHQAREMRCKVGLATMSYCPQVQKVLHILGLQKEFDFVATREDVEKGKPDPEIYRMVATQLNVPVDECLVIEDSPAGVKAAVSAGMHCIAVTTPFTRDAMRVGDYLPARWIVDDPIQLPDVVGTMLREQSRRHPTRSTVGQTT
jgi:beta-phosphoglucomutase